MNIFGKHFTAASIKNKNLLSYGSATLFIAIFVGLGIHLLIGSHAAGPFVSVNSDSGTVAAGSSSNCPQTLNSGSVSDGKYVVLNNPCSSGSGGTVSTAPDGVPNPSGDTWSLEYGDAFNDPIGNGTGQDNTWYPKRFNTPLTQNDQGFNSNEYEAFVYGQQSVNPNVGLDLKCSYTPDVAASGKNYDYSCGALSGDNSATSGYKYFGMNPGLGQQFAVQIVAKYPPGTGEADNNFWMSDPSWTEEIDFFEAFDFGGQAGEEWNHNLVNPNGSSNGTSNTVILTTDPTWLYNGGSGHPSSHIQAENDFWRDNGIDPSAGYHTYTTVFNGDGSFSEYLDGKLESWTWIPSGGADCTKQNGPCTTAGPEPSSSSHVMMGLILGYSMRNSANQGPVDSAGAQQDPYFTSGSRDYLIRSVSVYENTKANGANTQNDGLAPGTTTN